MHAHFESILRKKVKKQSGKDCTKEIRIYWIVSLLGGSLTYIESFYQLRSSNNRDSGTIRVYAVRQFIRDKNVERIYMFIRERIFLDALK